MFSQRFSPTTGKMEWVVEDEDYDMRNEIARCVDLRKPSVQVIYQHTARN